MKHFQSIFLAAFTLFAVSVVGIYAQNTDLPFSLYLPIATGNSQPNQATPVPTHTPIDELAMRREVIRLVNEYRVANGCPAASEHAALMNGAQAWSDYMRINGAGHSPMNWYTDHGYSRSAMENIGSGQETPEIIVSAWKTSSNHNRTLLSCRYATEGYVYDIGIGLNGRLWTLALGERLP